MRTWLMKSEPDVFSIQDLERVGFTGWDGVRNYQARNYMRDEMKEGDLVLFYHSNSKPPGIAGLARVTKTGVPDPTAFDPKSDYFDPKSKKESPRWIMVEVEFVEHFPVYIPLAELKKRKDLKGLQLLQKGNRLSIMPVSAPHFDIIAKLGHSRYRTLS
ncbi:MAG: EVE domain-containing protein [Chlamydiia bacterium]|nr:EVE domain-containing protein [Chlamydiia bacterium]